jgi:DNA-binding response OmpR family regulator
METAMVVEPRKQWKRLISEVLEEEGLRVQAFDAPEEAARQVAKLSPDIVIVDVHMPSRSGLQVLEQLRDSNVPVILIASHHGTALQHELYAVGDVLETPIESQDLRARLRGILKKHSRMARVHPKVQPGLHRVAAHVLPELHDPVTGRLDAGRIADYLGIPLSAFVKFAEISVAGLHKSPASLSLQERLIPAARSLTILSQLLGSKETVRTWMNSPHPDLGGRTPISIILEGKARAVSDMLEAALAGQPS